MLAYGVGWFDVSAEEKAAFTSRRAGRILIFDLDGDFSRTASPIPTLHDIIKEHIAKGVRSVLFNFEKTRFVDSFGIQQIIATYTSLQNLGGYFKLCGVTPKLMSLLVVTKLEDVLDIYPTEEAALAAFAGSL